MMNDPFRVSINVHERRMFDAHQYVHGFQSRLLTSYSNMKEFALASGLRVASQRRSTTKR